MENLTGSLEVNLTHGACKDEPPISVRMYRYYIFESIVNIGIVGILVLVGLLGNCLVILVMRSEKTNKTVNFLLQSLAVVDASYLIASFFIQTLTQINVLVHWRYFGYVEVVIWPLASIAQTAVMWIVVLVTVDRYVAVRCPFRKSCLSTIHRARAAVALIVTAAVLYNLPRFFEKQVKLDYVCDVTNTHFELVYQSRRTDMRKNRVYFILYKTILYMLLRLAIPLVTLFVLNIQLIRLLRAATQSHATLTQTRPKKDSFTVVLVAIVSVFLACEIPDAVLRVTLAVFHFLGAPYDFITMSYVNTTTNALLTLNSAVNCFIYTATGKNFRNRLRMLVCRQDNYNNSTSNERHLLKLLRVKRPVRSQRSGVTSSPRYAQAAMSEVTTTSTMLRDFNIELIATSNSRRASDVIEEEEEGEEEGTTDGQKVQINIETNRDLVTTKV